MITNFTQRWNNKKPVYITSANVINPRQYEVVEISDRIAKEYVLTRHYLASYPAARRRFGLYKNDRLCGVAVFSHPSNERTITNVFQCERASSGLELGRFILDDSVPYNGETWFLGRIRELIVKDYVGFVSFADDTRRTGIDGSIYHGGHIGKIYASHSMSFLGRGSAGTLRLLPDGKSLSNRTISKIRTGDSGWRYAAAQLSSYGATECPEDAEERRLWLDLWLNKLTRKTSHPGNLKYAASFSKKVKLASLPYPRIKISDVQPSLIFQ